MADRPGRRHLVIFARRPAYGRGKRRLAAEVGDLAAWRFQRFALTALLDRLGPDRRWRTWAAITPDRPSDWVRHATAIGQGPGDLGARLTRVARSLPAGAIVIIGSDAPQVTGRDIAQAFLALGRSDAVFGPATDGGFWLIGLSAWQRRRQIYEGIRWSSPHTLADAVRSVQDRSVGFLRELEDVDDAASLRRASRR